MRKSRKHLNGGIKRRRDKFHRDMRFAIRFENWLKLYQPDECVKEPLFNL